jgi:sigma-B regulation protein RsbU (phosphoserine phosphatase)
MTVDWESSVGSPARLAAVESSGLAGIAPEDEFDRLIELAVVLTRVPRGLIALVDSEHTTAMSSVGFPEGLALQAPVELSFCRYVVGSGRPLIVDDANDDPRTKGDPAIDAFAAVSVASYPMEDADGFVLGTFCVMDSKPHEWSSIDLQVLATLAKAASTEIALRRARAELFTARQR